MSFGLFGVPDAPKHTEIIQNSSSSWPHTGRPVLLSCHSLSFPPIVDYQWLRTFKDTSEDQIVSANQNFTVQPDKPGMYYCVAANGVGSKASDPITLFLDRESWCHLGRSNYQLITPFPSFHIEITAGNLKAFPDFWWRKTNRLSLLSCDHRRSNATLPSHPWLCYCSAFACCCRRHCQVRFFLYLYILQNILISKSD